MNMWNVHNSYIDNIGIPKHKQHNFLVQVRNFFITFALKGLSTWGERHNLSMLTFPSAPNTRGPRRAPNVNCLLRTLKLNQLWLFSNLSPRFRCVTSLTSLVISSIWDFYCDISEWHVRSCLHLTNPCTEPKGSQPN